MMSLSVFVARCDDCRLRDRLELRLAVVGHVGRLELLLVHARRLRHLREQHGFGGLRRARHRRQHARARVLERDLLEVCGGSFGVANVHGPVEVRRREPAAGDEEVDGAGPAHAEHVALGVLHPEQVVVPSTSR